MKHISGKLVLIGSDFNEAYKAFLLESDERKRNKLFEAMIPTIYKQISYIFAYLSIREPDLQEELIQLSYIKVYTKLTLERVCNVKNLNGYVRSIIINSIRDYFKASNNYNKHRREYKLLETIGIDSYGRVYIMKSKDTPQSDYIIKPII